LDDLLDENYDELSELYYQKKLIEPAKIDDIPEYGNHMTLEEFKSNCESGGFIDYDGYGYYATENKMVRNKTIIPSHFKKKKVLKDYTHVVWFNK
jgi:hypothetical protein